MDSGGDVLFLWFSHGEKLKYVNMKMFSLKRTKREHNVMNNAARDRRERRMSRWDNSHVSAVRGTTFDWSVKHGPPPPLHSHSFTRLFNPPPPSLGTAWTFPSEIERISDCGGDIVDNTGDPCAISGVFCVELLLYFSPAVQYNLPVWVWGRRSHWRSCG